MELTPNFKLNLPDFGFEPWDDEVNDNFSILDALTSTIVGVTGFSGIWMNAEPYTSGEQVIDSFDSTFWMCDVSHTSAAAPTSFAADRAANPTYWHKTQNNAREYAESAAASAADAAASAAAAEAAFNAIMPDAPRNDLMYGRINGTWQQAAPIMSPVLQGDPRAPTPPSTDNDTSIATTAFVQSLVGSVPAGVWVADTPPASAVVGALWWDDIGGQLYLKYSDVNSTQWVAVNSATGGTATGFLPLVGGTLTGFLTLNANPTSNLHAATKQYVDGKTWPYLPIGGGTLTGPLTVQGSIDANTMITSNNGRLMSKVASGYATLSLWVTPTGNRGLWSDGSTLAFGQLDGSGNGISTGMYLSPDNSMTVIGSIWATNRPGAFGLQDFSGGYWGIRFNSAGWRLQWNSADGTLAYINSANAGLFSINPSGGIWSNDTIQSTGRIYAGNGVAFNPYNSWEHAAYSDGSGNHFMSYRSGYYDVWYSSGGSRAWVNNNVQNMILNTAGDLSITGLFQPSNGISTGAGIVGGYLRSTLDANIDRNIGVGGYVSAGGDIWGSALYGPNGVFAGGHGDTNFGMYRSGGTTIINMWPNWYWGFNTSDGTLIWHNNGSNYWVMEGAARCYNLLGPTGGTYFMTVSDMRLKESIQPTSLGLAFIRKLLPRSFIRKSLAEGIAPAKEIGFIAQDVQEVAPEAIETIDVGSMKALTFNLMYIIVGLVNGMQELASRLEAVEAR